jgi:hypothetical protein
MPPARTNALKQGQHGILGIKFGLKSYLRIEVSWWNPASSRECPGIFCKANSYFGTVSDSVVMLPPTTCNISKRDLPNLDLLKLDTDTFTAQQGLWKPTSGKGRTKISIRMDGEALGSISQGVSPVARLLYNLHAKIYGQTLPTSFSMMAQGTRPPSRYMIPTLLRRPN